MEAGIDARKDFVVDELEVDGFVEVLEDSVNDACEGSEERVSRHELWYAEGA